MGKYAFEPSTNIEDRRGEKQSILKTVTGLTSEEWGRAFNHPLTPLWNHGDPPPEQEENSKGALAREAGIDNIK